MLVHVVACVEKYTGCTSWVKHEREREKERKKD